MIASWFDLVASVLELLILIPVLFVLSIELSLLVVITIPPFVYLQLRSGAFIVVAAQDVRETETSFSKFIEENLVFASMRKLLGLGRAFDARLRGLQEQVVEKFDVLDVFEAKSQLQIDAFSMALGVGVFGAGLALMSMELKPGEPMQGISMPSTCLLMPEELCGASSGGFKPNGDACPPGPGGGPTYRLDLSTLFAFVAGVQGVFPICAAFIGSIRKIQVGISSYTRVCEFMNVDAEPWEAHAALMNYRDAPSDSDERDGLLWLKGVVADPHASKWGDDDAAGGAVMLTVLLTHVEPKPPSQKFGICTNEEGVIDDFEEGGSVAAARDGLRIGDRILEINGKVMDGESINPIDQPVANSRSSQIATLLARLLREGGEGLERIEFLVRRGEAAALAALSATSDASTTTALSTSVAAAEEENLLHGDSSSDDDESAESYHKEPPMKAKEPPMKAKEPPMKAKEPPQKGERAARHMRVEVATQTLAAEFWRAPPRIKGPAIVVSNINYVSVRTLRHPFSQSHSPALLRMHA